MLARMHSSHGNIFEEGERLNGKRFIEVLFLYILLNHLIVNGLAINIGRAEEHPGGEIILVVNDVHRIESDVLFFELLLFLTVQHDDLIAVLGF